MLDYSLRINEDVTVVVLASVNNLPLAITASTDVER